MTRVGLLVAVALGAATMLPSSAQATDYWWYWPSGGTQNHWAENTNPAAPNDQSDTVGDNWIFGHTINTAAGGEPTQDGDWQTYYYVSSMAPLNASDPWSLQPYSGYTPPSPIGDYQIANSSNESTAAQASGYNWGWWINGNDPGNNCYDHLNSSGTAVPSLCNIYHFVWYNSTASDYPWSTSFGSSPVLVLGLNDSISQWAPAAHPNPNLGGGTAYATMEVYVTDTTTNQTLDIAVTNWGTPGWDPSGTEGMYELGSIYGSPTIEAYTWDYQNERYDTWPYGVTQLGTQPAKSNHSGTAPFSGDFQVGITTSTFVISLDFRDLRRPRGLMATGAV